MADASPQVLRPVLRKAIRLCFSYELNKSAKFLGQLLVSLPRTSTAEERTNVKEPEKRDEERAFESFVGNKEYARAAFWLNSKKTDEQDDLVLYRTIWARWQAHLKSLPFRSPLESTIPSKTGSVDHESVAAKLMAEIPEDTTNPFLLYMRAFLLMHIPEDELGSPENVDTIRLYAIGTLCDSLKGNPYNWDAWDMLKTLVKTETEVIYLCHNSDLTVTERISWRASKPTFHRQKIQS
ncbi:hypothetical protein BT69DRAFT_1358328 [Atractiella rhizophila]|nr:hypothetical protein BT69DRAFT_1358328 [Atractiella rhizophila]